VLTLLYQTLIDYIFRQLYNIQQSHKTEDFVLKKLSKVEFCTFNNLKKITEKWNQKN
jgi:hypothetical protein